VRASRVVDSHLHVWDLTSGGYGWLGPRHGRLHRSFLPEEAVAVLDEAGIGAAVLVQADDTVADTDFMLAAADRHPEIVGVVGWVRLDSPREAEPRLDALADSAAFRGVRHLVHDDPRDDFLWLPPVRSSLRAVAQRGLAFDVPDAWPRHLDAVTELARALPELTVVVDHLGKPPRGTGSMAAWEASLRGAASASPAVVAKLSGLQVPGQPFTEAALRPVLDVALDAFGADRLMYGGDWPMTVPEGGYLRHWKVVSGLLAELSASEQESIMWRTACRTYRLPDAGARGHAFRDSGTNPPEV
jgi:L-fucono-1,5-lactonase